VSSLAKLVLYRQDCIHCRLSDSMTHPLLFPPPPSLHGRRIYSFSHICEPAQACHDFPHIELIDVLRNEIAMIP
jgi:hypothetical protein